MTSANLIGSLAALVTTLCWLPQALHIIRTKDAASVSGFTYSAFAAGIGLWLVYGLLIESWPVMIANSVTFLLLLVILAMKWRYRPRKRDKTHEHFP